MDPATGEFRKISVRDEDIRTKAETKLYTGTVIEDHPASFAPVVWLMGARPSCGTRTLAAMAQPFAIAEQFPVHDEFPNIVVVAEATKTALQSAHSLVLQARQLEQIRLIGVAVVDRTGARATAEVQEKISELGKQTRIFEIPYIDQVRDFEASELATWSPLVTIDTSRKGKKMPPNQQVPLPIVARLEEIFNAARGI